MTHSTRISDPLSKVVSMFLGILLALAAVPGRAQSLPADGAEAVRGFYPTLLSTMKMPPPSGQKAATQGWSRWFAEPSMFR